MSKLKFNSINDFISASDRNFIFCIDYNVKWTLGTKITSKCLTHQYVYRLVPKTFLTGAGCPKCRSNSIGISLKNSTEKFIQQANKIHNHQYDYSKVIYKNSTTKITIICKKHGEFSQSPTNHVHGKNGCPKCKIAKILPNFSTTNISKSETKWLNSLGVQLRQYPIEKIFVDGYDPVSNTIYEYLGDFWHGNLSIYNSNDINPRNKKTFGELWELTKLRFDFLISKGYKVIYIWHSDAIKNKSPYTYSNNV